MSYNEQALAHHGIKGQKWGVRRFQKADGSLTPAGKSRYASDLDRAAKNVKTAKKEYNRAFDKAYNRAIQGYSPLKKQREANDQRWDEAASKRDALLDAKEGYKKTVQKNVDAYEKKFESASKASDAADAQWNDVKSQYKALGKTKVTRMLRAGFGKSDAVKKYRSDYDKASEASDAADAQWREAAELYKTTGRNRVERILNNIKYGS